MDPAECSYNFIAADFINNFDNDIIGSAQDVNNPISWIFTFDMNGESFTSETILNMGRNELLLLGLAILRFVLVGETLEYFENINRYCSYFEYDEYTGRFESDGLGDMWEDVISPYVGGFIISAFNDIVPVQLNT